MPIEFTQYHLPDGRKSIAKTERPQVIEMLADKLKKAGARFEAEILTTGQVSFEILLPVDGDDPETLSTEICPNGPECRDAVDRLVKNACVEIKKRG